MVRLFFTRSDARRVLCLVATASLVTLLLVAIAMAGRQWRQSFRTDHRANRVTNEAFVTDGDPSTDPLTMTTARAYTDKVNAVIAQFQARMKPMLDAHTHAVASAAATKAKLSNTRSVSNKNKEEVNRRTPSEAKQKKTTQGPQQLLELAQSFRGKRGTGGGTVNEGYDNIDVASSTHSPTSSQATARDSHETSIPLATDAPTTPTAVFVAANQRWTDFYNKTIAFTCNRNIRLHNKLTDLTKKNNVKLKDAHNKATKRLKGHRDTACRAYALSGSPDQPHETSSTQCHALLAKVAPDPSHLIPTKLPPPRTASTTTPTLAPAPHSSLFG